MNLNLRNYAEVEGLHLGFRIRFCIWNVIKDWGWGLETERVTVDTRPTRESRGTPQGKLLFACILSILPFSKYSENGFSHR